MLILLTRSPGGSRGKHDSVPLDLHAGCPLEVGPAGGYAAFQRAPHSGERVRKDVGLS